MAHKIKAKLASAIRSDRFANGATPGGPATEAGPGSTPPASPVRVLCVDDHELLVEGLKVRFAMDGGLQVVGHLSSAERLVEEVGRLRPEVVILDIEMPGPDAFESADRLRRKYPDVRVIVLSAHVRDAFISASFRVGIWGYFAKSDELADIIRGVHLVARSEEPMFLLGPRIQERCRPLPDRMLHSDDRPDALSLGMSPEGPRTLLDTLTPREEEILRFIGKGMSRTKIAEQLCRSVKTVDAHQTRMMRKLGISERADLMRFAIREGFAQA